MKILKITTSDDYNNPIIVQFIIVIILAAVIALNGFCFHYIYEPLPMRWLLTLFGTHFTLCTFAFAGEFMFLVHGICRRYQKINEIIGYDLNKFKAI